MQKMRYEDTSIQKNIKNFVFLNYEQFHYFTVFGTYLFIVNSFKTAFSDRFILAYYISLLLSSYEISIKRTIQEK
jgi:hypothetical protein